MTLTIFISLLFFKQFVWYSPQPSSFEHPLTTYSSSVHVVKRQLMWHAVAGTTLPWFTAINSHLCTYVRDSNELYPYTALWPVYTERVNYQRAFHCLSRRQCSVGISNKWLQRLLVLLFEADVIANLSDNLWFSNVVC